MQQLARLDACRPPGWLMLARAELLRIFGHMWLHHGPDFSQAAPQPESDGRRLAPALTSIERDLSDGPIVVRELAELCQMSEVHLRTVFRRATGMAPHHYVQSRAWPGPASCCGKGPQYS